ncbi:MAG TPA: hypothetical protein VGW38_24800, partial [Chloroflexota bacterium]|nr:hypothetical protein [Chloroflexota bacterium]
EQRPLLGRPLPHVLVRIPRGLAYPVPVMAGGGKRPVWGRLVFGPHVQHVLGVGGFDQVFFAAAR